MGMKGVICEVLCDEQKEIIKSLENQLKGKNEIIIKETKRANEMFQLSFNRKLKIQEQQAEINRLREALQSIKQQTINLEDYEEIGAIATISDICDKTLNSEKEEK